MSLSVVSWNVNGLRALVAKTPLATLFAACGSPDVLCLQETKLSASSEDAKRAIGRSVEGHESFWNTCAARSGYAGVAVFARHNLVTAVHDWFPQGGDGEDGPHGAVLRAEGRVLVCELGPQLVLINVYVPNGGKEAQGAAPSEDGDGGAPMKSEFLRRLRGACDAYRARGRSVVLVGRARGDAVACEVEQQRLTRPRRRPECGRAQH